MRTPRFTRSIVVAAAIGGTALLGACEPRVAQRGAMPDIDAIAKIIPNESTKQDVERVLGSPSSVNVFGNETWMYIGETTTQTAFLERKVDERSVLTINFDKGGVVTDVQSHGLDASRDIAPVERTTPTVGRDLTLVEQLLGNLNRFRSIGQSEQ